jgi:hypothetical protein
LNLAPEPNTTKTLLIPIQTGNMSLWPPDAEKLDAYEAAGATAGEDPGNTETAECKEDTETLDGNATAGAA